MADGLLNDRAWRAGGWCARGRVDVWRVAVDAWARVGRGAIKSRGGRPKNARRGAAGNVKNGRKMTAIKKAPNSVHRDH